MATYFIVCVYHDKERGWGEYEEYIRLVKPIVEEYGGRYIVRSEAVETLDRRWEPERVIAIRFPDRGSLDACFGSEAYQRIMEKRTSSVDSRAVIAPGI